MVHLVSPYNFFPPYLLPYLSFCFSWFLYLSLNLSPLLSDIAFLLTNWYHTSIPVHNPLHTLLLQLFHQLLSFSCILSIFPMTPFFPKMFLCIIRIFLLPLFFLWTLILSSPKFLRVMFIAFICICFIYLSLNETNAAFQFPFPRVCLSFLSLSSLTFILHMIA